MILLDVQHIKKIYKTRFQGTQVEALKDIHFTVEKGEYVAIMGESGSGKSTLLNILAMLGLPQWHRHLDHQEQGCVELSSGKTRLCLSRFQFA